MKKIVNICVMIVFTGIFAYLFFGNLENFIDFFKNAKNIDVDYFYNYGRSVLMPLFGFVGLLTSIILLISACLGKTKSLDRKMGSLVTLLVMGFFFTELISAIPAAISHQTFDILTSSTFTKFYLIFIFCLVASIGLSFRKAKLIKAIVTSVGVLGILIIDILLMKEMNFSMDLLKLLPGYFIIYIFIILACVGVGAYVWLGGESKQEA